MSFVAVHHHAALTVATDRLVLPADEVQLFQTTHELAQALAGLRDAESQRIDAAHRAARAAGHAQGFAEGLQQAQCSGAEQLADTLIQLAAQAESERAALREAVLTLSLLIVRRIAAHLPREALVAALAQQAFDHLAADQAQRSGAESAVACVVRLHPSLLSEVRARIEQRLDPEAPSAIEWRADESLGRLDCVVDTPGGRLLVGLEAQLERVRSVLQESCQAARVAASEAVMP